MTAQEIQNIREKFAGYDMQKARKNNGLIITETIHGNIELNYFAASKTYEIVGLHTMTPAQYGRFTGDAKATKKELASLYEIVLA